MYSDKVWEWKNKEQTAFEALKIAMTTTLVLVSSQDLEPFYIEVDSFDFATGTILSQQSTIDKRWRPAAFYSKFLSLAERNYKIYNQKMLAIICVLEK